VRSVRLVQDRHLECIRAASFLWLICPDGYVGQSASMEIGYAAGAGVPIFAAHAPSDLTLREYVAVVPGLAAAVRIAATRGNGKRPEGLLIDPHASVEHAHRILDRLGTALTRPRIVATSDSSAHTEVKALLETLSMPAYMQ
jgi:hypothetical protein